MAQQIINVGTAAGDGSGDPLRLAMQKVNANTTELYAGLPSPGYLAKLDDIEEGATANSPDGFLIDRANHTGTQLAATISDFSAACAAAVGGSPDVGRRNALLSAILTATNSGAPVDMIDRWADGFASSGGIVSGSSSHYSVSAGAVSPTNTPALIAAATGTVIGSMPNRAAIGNAFDGVTSQASSSCVGCNPTGGWVGKDWGSGVTKTISRFTIYGPSNATLTANTGGNVTCVLRGSNTSPANSADGTALYTLTLTSPSGTSQSYDVASGIIATAYRYVWLDCTTTGSEICIAEVQFYEPGAANNLTLVVGSGLSADAAPSTIRALLDVTPVDAVTIGTDLTVEVSRDGGTTWTAAGSYATVRTIGARKIIETDAVSVTSQPSGTSVRARLKSLNNKSLSIGGVALEWA